MGNTNLQWEKTHTFDGNFEIQFLNGLVSANINYYVKTTKDLLADITLPPSSGFEVTGIIWESWKIKDMKFR